MLKQDQFPSGKNGIGFPSIAIPFLLLLTTACNEAFEPWQENDQYFFSIFGYLDATADTQWVRVMPVREDFFLDPDKPFDAVVTLEHMESEESVIMNDTLFAYAHGVYAWNFWTTMDLKPEQTYRITAKNSDGQASHTTVILPPDFPTPIVRIASRPFGTADLVFIEGVERLADAQTVYHGRGANGSVSIRAFPHRHDTSRTASGDLQIAIDFREDRRELENFSPVFKSQIFIAAANPDFIDFGNIQDRTAALPDGVSNIENGTGYLAGIVSKTIPYESCIREGSTDLIPCELQPPPW